MAVFPQAVLDVLLVSALRRVVDTAARGRHALPLRRHDRQSLPQAEAVRKPAARHAVLPREGEPLVPQIVFLLPDAGAGGHEGAQGALVHGSGQLHLAEPHVLPKASDSHQDRRSLGQPGTWPAEYINERPRRMRMSNEHTSCMW